MTMFPHKVCKVSYCRISNAHSYYTIRYKYSEIPKLRVRGSRLYLTRLSQVKSAPRSRLPLTLNLGYFRISQITSASIHDACLALYRILPLNFSQSVHLNPFVCNPCWLDVISKSQKSRTIQGLSEYFKLIKEGGILYSSCNSIILIALLDNSSQEHDHGFRVWCLHIS